MNHAIDRIVDGDRAERLPTIGFASEFDDLTRNLDRMLDRNAAAMEALYGVTPAIADADRGACLRIVSPLIRRDPA